VGGIVLALGLAATAVWALSTKWLYRSEAVVVFERGVQSGALGPGEDTPRQVSARLYDSLTSRTRLVGLVKQYRLYPQIVEQRNVVEAVEEMRKHIAMSGRESFTYRASYDGETRELAQKVLDTLSKGVVDEDTTRRQREAEETRKFLDTERAHADDDVRAKELALAQFINEHPRLAPEAGGNAGVGAVQRAEDRDRPTDSGSGIAALEMQQAQLEQQLADAGQGTGDVAGDPVLVAARSRAHQDLQSANLNLAEKQAQFTNEHPDVKAALRRVADAEAAVRRAEAALAAAKSSPGLVKTAGGGEESGRVGALKRALAAVRGQIASLKSRGAPHVDTTRTPGTTIDVDTRFTKLTREVTEARDRQSQLETKQFQAKLTATLVAGGQGGRLVITDPPFRPLRPVAGGRFKIVMVGGAMSLLLALLAVSALAAFDDRLYGARDVERVVEDPIVVVVPRLPEREREREGERDRAGG
jgi:uncharacterized protein involved in exopolysaccharide biosynthesis